MRTLADYTRFRFRRDGRILVAPIAAPGPVNAVDAVLHEELAHLFDTLARDPESDLVVLTGEGRAFSAGGDFAWFQEQVREPARFRALVPDARRIVTSLLDCDKPVICRLNGPAAGLGATIALLCDVIVADETARIGDPHVKVGLVAGDGGAILWPQLVGFVRAKEWLLTGDLMTAAEAARIGLVNYAVPADQLDAKVAEVAARILANPRWAVRWTKTVVNQPLKALVAQMMDSSLAHELLSNLTADRAEAVAALVARRPPRFTGE
ncbi:MAG: enoyl-CoA hydratase-related protein [Sphingomonadaceae bacterium]|uniref:enoyl-CoA hydratase/isomerase family protein n=1 Tax=Thermaurantiacus sp. TaxID=2820283 RepID=UPI00298EF3A3|nr:enoyl-CoA hydratase-related protein [Thermaurantiacus sp.]MCS6987033.1 enoyl-CoA hydratase-related protein [Sphingomonadaceae bacterium]MDW8415629.1 enoyl-CoA hydratase-related protein [Thermaurantiacus sp.]